MVDLTVDEDESFILANGIISHNSARKSIQEARGKNPLIGSFALKGKPLNITDCKRADILENDEIKSILLITGLKIGVPVKGIGDLRFGKIVIMSDQDLDGFHVSALLLNFFHHFWPELFKLGIIYRINTPLVIATLPKKVTQEFMTDEAYEEWAKTAPKHTARRYKGLGAFNTPVFKQIIEQRERYLVKFNSIEAADVESLSLAFSGARADDRKDWLGGVNYFSKFE
jgi:DNA topoisomerase-2